MTEEHPIIRELTSGKSDFCRTLLSSLPDWFGIPSAIEKYASEIDSLRCFVAILEGEQVGLLSLSQLSTATWEIHVMAVSAEYHRRGIGKDLLKAATTYLREQSAKLLTVKTLSAKRENEAYARTREFYRGAGFIEVEEFTDLWDEANPCLMMALIL